MSTARIAILLGSTRNNSNCVGLAAWLTSVLRSRPSAEGLEIVPVDLTSTSYTLGPLVDGLMPMLVKDPALYTTPEIRKWSAFIRSCSGFVVLSPQYNAGYPGELKNALDHLYHEWAGKPTVLVTYGGQGGPSAAEQLKKVLGALKVNLLEEQPQLSLPREYIITPEKRVSTAASVALHGTEQDTDPFLQAFVKPVEAALDALISAVTVPTKEA